MKSAETNDSVIVDDILILEKQLGRKPNKVAAIASRCRHGYPQVIQNHVFIDSKPFPTLYWLTCPLKVRAVSRIEGQGWSERIKQMIEENRDLKEELLLAHEDYRLRRQSSASGLNHAILETGIGGVRDTEGIKCLHAHYAHYLATAINPLGELVDKLVGNLDCERRCDNA